MSAAKHTPGPWLMRRRDGEPHGDSDNLGWDWVIDANHQAPPEPLRGVCALEADARLIAAAPDLAEALKQAMDALSDVIEETRNGVKYRALWDTCAAAMSKAGL